MVINILILFAYLIVCFIIAMAFSFALLYCICWVLIFVDELINNDWKDKND